MRSIPFQRITLETLGLAQFECKSLVCAVILNRRELEQFYGHPGSCAVDFNRHLLVAVHRGLCPTGGYSCKVMSVIWDKDCFYLNVAFRDPSPEEFVTLIATYPYDTVLIDKVWFSGLSHARFRFRRFPGGDYVNEKVITF